MYLVCGGEKPVFPGARLADAGEREALGRLTSASPYSSIKFSNTSLDHLLLGTAADWMIIGLYFAVGQICGPERKRLTGIWEPVSDNAPFIRTSSQRSKIGRAFKPFTGRILLNA